VHLLWRIGFVIDRYLMDCIITQKTRDLYGYLIGHSGKLRSVGIGKDRFCL